MKRLGLILLIFFLAACAFYLFVDFIDDIRSHRTAEAKADAIVVLTGGKGRVEEGLTQLRKGRAGILILSGVHQDATSDSIFLNRLNESERSNIILEKKSRSTYENAVEVRRLMMKKGLKSMVLVTSGYHMKRAEFIFKKLMPRGVTIIPYSVTTPNFDENRWWDEKSLLILVIEFVKYYLFAAGFGIGVIGV